MPATDFVEFLVRHKASGASELVRVNLRQPVRLYDDHDRGYRAARAFARRRALYFMGQHPCSRVTIEPHDWSDGCEKLTEQQPA